MNYDRFHADVLDYNEYEAQRDDRHTYICKHIEKNSWLNHGMLSRVVNRTYSLEPLTDDTTRIPCRWYTDLAFDSYIKPNLSAEYEYWGTIFANHYLFEYLLSNVNGLYRRKYRPFEAVVYQYLDLRNAYWQSLPF